MSFYSPANRVCKLVYWCGLKEVGCMETEAKKFLFAAYAGRM